jgi:PHS family inorganic phosphate transporter-like MFS transporter
MVSQVVFAIATGIGLLTDKYMLEATNFVEHYAVDMQPTDSEKEFIKSAMYAGAILGMASFGPLSDVLGRRVCLILCSVITSAGAMLSTFAWSPECLIVARIITGVGMGGEYPLASAHSAESTEDSGNGARNVALLYLFGSGGGPALCDLVTYLLDLSGMPSQHIWRAIFAFGAALSFIGLFLRFFTTRDSEKHIRAVESEKVTRTRTGKSARWSFLGAYWKPLLGTASIWLLFDIVEYGLKQNDAAIFSEDKSGPYRNSVLTVFFTRLLVLPSLAIAPLLLKLTRSKWVQAGGFCGCILANLTLAMFYTQLHKEDLAHVVSFDSLYIVQLSFQSLPGVTTMAIPAEIFPSTVKGTGAGISAASGKVGAVLGSYFFTMMKNNGHIEKIFWVVACTSAFALVLTLLLTPLYSGETIDRAEALAADGQMKEACKILYSDPQGHEKGVPGVGEGDYAVEP